MPSASSQAANTKLVADLMGDVTRLFATDSLDGGDLMLWADEQRGIGELMIVERTDAPPACVGYASFVKDPKLLEPWLNRVADQPLSSFAPRANAYGSYTGRSRASSPNSTRRRPTATRSRSLAHGERSGRSTQTACRPAAVGRSDSRRTSRS
jgi:hypothetical protein